jgi:nicotinamide riboside kinase
MFSLHYHQAAHDRLIELAILAQSRYDLVFLCDADIPYDDTWDRSGDVNRKIFQKQIVGDLLARKIPFIVLSGDVNTRVSKVKKVLNQFKKYRSLNEIFMKKENIR